MDAVNTSRREIKVDKQSCPSPHSLANKLGRVLWGSVWTVFFRPSPRILFGWRRRLLRCFGAAIGRNARISPSVRIWAPWNLEVGEESSIAHHVDCYCVDRIQIGAHATVSQYSHLCAASHDVSSANMELTMSPILIEDNAWVCADVFVGPGVTIGQGAVAGARAVVVKDIAPWDIVAGNPARVIGVREIKQA